MVCQQQPPGDALRQLVADADPVDVDGDVAAGSLVEVRDLVRVQDAEPGRLAGGVTQFAQHLARLSADREAIQHKAGQRHKPQAQPVAGGALRLLEQPAALERRHQARCGAAVHAQRPGGLAHADDRAVLVEQLQDRDRTLDSLASRDLLHALILRIVCIIRTLRAR